MKLLPQDWRFACGQSGDRLEREHQLVVAKSQNRGAVLGNEVHLRRTELPFVRLRPGSKRASDLRP